ncbi:transcriptional Coactivator p15-domain-containing protein [Myxozyma melibiosi]|uniref:Transcriptional Coactivator p15-domain-containing protein n=1 Tax=Myxozyma melibiosi TaxID=54550 RepID=A0ABR1F2B2_9ASCO
MQSILEIDKTDLIFEQLGHKKRLHVREFKGATLVDIREYYTKADAPDTWLPGKKGISLSVDVWNEVVKNIEKVNEAIGKIEPAKKAKVDDEEAGEKHEDEEE